MKTIEALREGLDRLPVLDTHEHLVPERQRLEGGFDVLSLLLEIYIGGDLLSSGMSRNDLNLVVGRGGRPVPLEEKWKRLAPYWPQVSQTGYGRMIRLALKRFFGLDRLDRPGLMKAQAIFESYNRAGIYRKILEEAGIRKVITQRTEPLEPGESELFELVIRPVGLGSLDRPGIENLEKRLGRSLPTLDAFLEGQRAFLKSARATGCLGLKTAAWCVEEAELETAFSDLVENGSVGRPRLGPARAAYQKLAAGNGLRPAEQWTLNSSLMHHLADCARELDLVMVIHTGAVWNAWIDFRVYNPLHIVPLLRLHPETKFDVYHAGIPWCREMAMIAKVFPNAWVNLTWAHIISPAMTISFLDELLDMVPPGKILGFGGDYVHSVENVIGHLEIARENLAAVLARRIEKGLMDRSEAVAAARGWLWDNPARLYGIADPQPKTTARRTKEKT
ncbi:MAG TPA: amidohydrolase family protein [bacterium]|uniref:Glucuronate isomerase n=1 Tax=candidate division TA06 bacterium ADurb.Bin417 TaxID=1852828 RepID=A0A1V5MJT2_UNCT6|nr:MAG: glucuronate isomerase [candidate division TA06 bacterium ADurb.Bin417]HNQ35419.1 amidohydrolase family protein [bacterium]HNS48638.1 amidohydrolase family protein [bacterium]